MCIIITLSSKLITLYNVNTVLLFVYNKAYLLNCNQL